MAGFVVGFRCAHAHQIVGWAEPAKPNMGCPGDRQCWASCVSPTYAEQVVADQKVEESDEVEEVIMAFVNEYASDEDIVKFRLNEIWDRYHPYDQGNHFFGQKPDFTVDRKRDVFLITIGQGSGEIGNRTFFILSWRGVAIRFDLDLVQGSSAKLTDRPFFMVWELKRFDLPEKLETQWDEILNTLKAAVEAFGYRGAKKQIPNTVVKFNF